MGASRGGRDARRSSAVLGAVMALAALGGYLMTAAAADTPTASILSLQGMSTNVDLDPTTAAVLKQNKVTVAPVGPATVTTAGDTTTASFPITEGYVSVYPDSKQPYVRGTFSHSGGLKFSAGGKSLTATDFIVNPGSSTLTATVGGKGVQLLDLDGSNLKITQDGATTRLEGTVAKLSATAAAALNQTFGVSLFQQGIPLGVVRIGAQGTAAPTDEPSAEIQQLGGTSTSVDLDPATAAVLQQNKVAVAPVEPATATTSGDKTTVSFPITEGYVSVYPQTQQPFIRGTFSHVGGIKFSAGGKSLSATDFIVNPGSSSLTATVGGSPVKLLDLDGSNVKVTSEGATTRLDGTIAKLSAPAAEALNKTFGVSVFSAGIPIGEVHVVAVPGPPPAIVGDTAAAAAPASGSAPQTPSAGPAPTGGVAAGGGGTADLDGSSSVTLPAALALVALLFASAGLLWRFRTRQTSRAPR